MKQLDDRTGNIVGKYKRSTTMSFRFNIETSISGYNLSLVIETCRLYITK